MTIFGDMPSQVDTTILGLDDERAKEMPFIASMGIYVISKDVMLNLLRDKFPGANDFGSEVIPGATEIGLRVCYIFPSHHLLLLSVSMSMSLGPKFLSKLVRFKLTCMMVIGKILGL